MASQKIRYTCINTAILQFSENRKAGGERYLNGNITYADEFDI